ncbi:MAG TPA: tetratricopeptide repeat protein [Tepidisphaeraceae bacterium]|nr:tetratricopeptide repeat protein [Tepidisphaeraceae bacterium]
MAAQQTLNLAFQRHQAGDLTEAEKLYRQVLTEDPKNVDALTLMGIMAYQAGNPSAAIGLIQNAIAIRPTEAKCHLHLGIALENAGRLPEAIAAYNKAIQLQQPYPQALCNLGKALERVGQTDAAIAACQEAARQAPNLPEAHTYLGIALSRKGLTQEAIEAFKKSVQLRPRDADAMNNLGLAYSRRDDQPAAIATYRQSLAIRPNDLTAINSLGVALQRNGEINEAEQCFRRVLAARPNDATIHWNLAELLLSRGDFEGAWPQYEWRERIIERLVPHPFTGPRWEGGDIAGKRIVIHNEWGLGDILQLVRYIPMILERGGTVILASPPELLRLFNNRWPGVQVIDASQPAPQYDLRCEMSSLPFAFRTTLKSIPANIPYLSADPKLSEIWKSRMPTDARRKVGIVWANQPNPPGRCPPPEQWSALARMNDIWFCSLQKPIARALRKKGETTPPPRFTPPPPPGMALTDWTNELNDFADTAALLANLDLLICIDTATAHLAAAMGKPVWLLLKHVPDWRWMLNRPDSPWYPTMRLFRQPTRGDWQTPIQQIVSELK